MINSTTNKSFEFDVKNSFDSHKEIDDIRSRSFKLKPIVKQESSVWDIKPVDFTWKLYQPQPPKRNSRESMKPQKYNEKINDFVDDLDKHNDKDSKKQLLDEFLDENNRIQRLAFLPDLQPQEPTEFKGSFRLQTPNGARIEASKTMGYRDGLEKYKLPTKYDHRPLKPIKSLGLPEFNAKIEPDPFNINLKLNGLSQIHGESNEIKGLYGYKSQEFPKNGLQMGDLVLKQPSKYISTLILPKLPYPNQFYGYTRYRNQSRPVEEAVWERMLEKINKNWKERDLVKTQNIFIET